MAKISSKKSTIRSPHSKKQQEILKALETAARRLGLRVSSGQLRFAGLKLRGGHCRLRDNQWLILDRSQPFDDLLDIYRQAISLGDLVECGLASDLVEMLTPYFTPAQSCGRGQAA